MKFSEALHQNQKIEVKLPSTLNVTPEAFMQMWTQNSVSRRVSNPHLITELKNEWQRSVSSLIEIKDGLIEIDTRQIRQIDSKTKQLNEVSDMDLLQLDIEELAIGRAIVTLQAENIHEKYLPTLSILLSEKGEKFAFGETVRVCTDLTIFGSEHLIDTTVCQQKGKKWTTEMAVAYFNQHLFKQTQKKFDEDFSLIENLKTKIINRKEFLAFMGDLHQKIEIANHARNQRTISRLSADEKSLVVNSRQLAKIAIESKTPSHEDYSWQNDTTTLWNVVNYGTEHLKAAHGSDMNTLFETNEKWVSLVQTYPFKFN